MLVRFVLTPFYFEADLEVNSVSTKGANGITIRSSKFVTSMQYDYRIASRLQTIPVRLRDGLLMTETCKVAVIWVSGKDDSHFENFCHPPPPYN